jgi:hypothetical protein
MAKKTVEDQKYDRRVGFYRGLVVLMFMGLVGLFTQTNTLDNEGMFSPSSPINTHGGTTKGDATLANFYAPTVLYWRDRIIRWGVERNLNPNLIATIMQIESCGHPYVSSHAGAQGLFQVMPLHFQDGENQIDPEINASRGLNHLQDCLKWSDYDVGIAFACYNGGPSVIGVPQSQWYEESRSYYKWGSGIYREAVNGGDTSPTLNEWLGAGGSILCQQAAEVQQVFTP